MQSLFFLGHLQWTFWLIFLILQSDVIVICCGMQGSKPRISDIFEVCSLLFKIGLFSILL